MQRIKLIIEYDGTNYCGWQFQPGEVTLQGKIEEALLTITRENIRIHGSGRTDAGVHARGQVAHFETACDLEARKYSRSLNSCLPKDISIRLSEEAAPDFHARYSATGKLYSYEIDNAKNRPAIDRHKAWWMKDIIDFELLQETTQFFIGEHDFTSFTDGEKKEEDNVRTVRKAEWVRSENQLMFRIEGKGFLYKMVRIIVGTSVDIARGSIPISKIPEMFEAKSRKAAGQTAPAQGLCLEEVYY
ncbi:MAG: tRNA pseudouridine(38-40) synthase TruA [Planctomycetota bacterium]|jgi:tRNA pseudouridine38-40 synthase